MAEQKNDSPAINRIIECLSFFNNLEPSTYHNLLGNENVTKHLVDDFNTVLMDELGDDQLQKQSRGKFNMIYKKVTKVIKDAKIEDSAIFKRNQRNRDRGKLFDDEEKILNAKDNDELLKLKFYIEMLDTIYVYFLFSYDMGCRLPPEISGESPEESDTESISKTENPVPYQGDMTMEGDELKKIQDDEFFNKIKDFVQTKREKLSKIHGADFKNTRFVTKINEDDSVKYPDIIPPLQRKVTPEVDEKKEEKKDDVYIINSFGYTFYYWDSFKNKQGGEKVVQNNGYKYSQLFVVAKYKDFKEELLNNTIKCISMGSYDLVLYHAKMRLQCEYAKTSEDMLAYGSTCSKYGIKSKAPITLEHLLAVVVYCRYVNLSKEFAKTHRKILEKERIVDVKKRNSEFAVWSRILRETVECYGRTLQFAKNKRLYHGVNGKLVFPSFCARFSCPSLLTTQLSVAAVYANETGVILELERGTGKLRFFNCNWLSPFSSDESRLVMGGEHRIKIGSIYAVKDGFNYKLYLRAMNYFRYFVEGREPTVNDYGTTTLKAKKTDYKILRTLFKHFDDRKEVKDFKCKFPPYVLEMFDVFRYNTREIKLDHKLMNKHYNRIAELFFDLSENSYNQLLIGEICMLFPRCLKITVTYKKFDMPNMDDWEFSKDLGVAAKYTKVYLKIIINNIVCDVDSMHVINNSEQTKGVWKSKKQGKNGLEVDFVGQKK